MKNTEKLHVLYAEDDEDARFMASVLLGFSDISVTAAGSIVEAQSLAHTEHFDLYLLDSRFPDGSGLDLCRSLREFAPQTPILFYSGDAFETDKQKGIIAGANGYLTKPNVDELAETIIATVKLHNKRCYS